MCVDGAAVKAGSLSSTVAQLIVVMRLLLLKSIRLTVAQLIVVMRPLLLTVL